MDQAPPAKRQRLEQQQAPIDNPVIGSQLKIATPFNQDKRYGARPTDARTVCATNFIRIQISGKHSIHLYDVQFEVCILDITQKSCDFSF